MLPVPVRGHVLVVPDGGGLGVAEVARLARVVRGVDEQRLHREGLQVARLELRHVVGAEEAERKRIRWAGIIFVCRQVFTCLFTGLQREFSQDDFVLAPSKAVCFFFFCEASHCVRLIFGGSAISSVFVRNPLQSNPLL